MSKDIPSSWFDVTPSDTTIITPCVGLYVGSGGAIRAAGLDGIVGTFQAQAGQYLVGEFSRVLATGTTAQSIVALFG